LRQMPALSPSSGSIAKVSKGMTSELADATPRTPDEGDFKEWESYANGIFADIVC